MSTLTTIGRYEVFHRIGRGGMGSLYLARDPNISRLVAIKVLNADVNRPEIRVRFAREATTAGTLTHPNIVTIFDSGVVHDAPYLVMEYIRGETLGELIARRARLSLDQKLALLEQLCHGLCYAHDAGIIHRDIKPMNLMIDHHGVLKILDFGIARLTDTGMTSSSMPLGTPGYMSPEQIEGHHIRAPTDLFAVGAVAYELLSYTPAFGGRSQLDVINKVMHDSPVPLPALVPDLSPALVGIVMRALARKIPDRYPDARSLLRDLQDVRQALNSGSPVPPARIDGPVPLPRGTSKADAAVAWGRWYLEARAWSAAGRAAAEALALDPENPGALALSDAVNAAAKQRDPEPASDLPHVANAEAPTRLAGTSGSRWIFVLLGLLGLLGILLLYINWPR